VTDYSLQDVLAGLGLITGLMALLLPYLGTVDYFLLHSQLAPLICILVPLALVLIYPTPHCWNTTRRDTTYILAAGSGISLGHWLSFQSGFMMQATTPPPYDIIPPTWTWAALVVVRMALGVGVLLAVRAVVAAVTYRIACRLAGIDPRDTAAARRHTVVDLSHKYITYTTIAAGMVFAAPMLFRAIGIERETYFTEI
jgi:sphingosine-1-phosphate phosphatase 1